MISNQEEWIERFAAVVDDFIWAHSGGGSDKLNLAYRNALNLMSLYRKEQSASSVPLFEPIRRGHLSSSDNARRVSGDCISDGLKPFARCNPLSGKDGLYEEVKICAGHEGLLEIQDSGRWDG